MSSLNFQISSISQPYTPQSDIATTSIAGLFNTMSDNVVSGFTGNNFLTQSSDLNSAEASLKSKVSSASASAAAVRTTLATSITPSANSQSSIASAAASASGTGTASPNTASSNPSSPNASSTAALSSSLSQTGTGAETGTGTSTALSEQNTDASGSGTGTTNTVSTTSPAANDGTPVAKSASGGGMSAGTKAAIAVPIVVIALIALVLAILFMRRRKRKREEKGEPAEKVPLAARKKRWTRHLRIFSFDTELLMGGRFSSTNSVRTRETGSMRSGTSSQNSQAPSVHTVDEVAPPYRDAISAAQPPSIGQVMAGAAAVGVGRSLSNATAGTAGTAGTMGTAPPPYRSGASRAATPATPVTPSTIGRRNPFSDSAPVSPIEASPFGDPVGPSPGLSRNSSLYHTERDDSSTIGGASEAASIREATLARNASVMSGGRIINNVNKS